MNILLFVLLPVAVVTAYAFAVWVRGRQPSSVESGVDAFRREMNALSPDAAPVNRRPERSEAFPDLEPEPPAPRDRPVGRAPSPPTRPAGPRRPGTPGDELGDDG